MSALNDDSASLIQLLKHVLQLVFSVGFFSFNIFNEFTWFLFNHLVSVLLKSTLVHVSWNLGSSSDLFAFVLETPINSPTLNI